MLNNPRFARFRFRFWLVLALVSLGLVQLLVAAVFSYGFFPALCGSAVWFGLMWWLHDKGIGIKCDHCKQYIATNTPWICGFRGCRNDNVNVFPFVHRCQHCHAEPKAYQCHHCKGLIFLGQDRLSTGYAHCVITQTEASTQKPPTLQEEVQRLQQELQNMKLKADLERQKQELEEIQKPSSRRKRELDTLLGEAKDKLAASAELFALREKWRKETSENPNLTAEQKVEQLGEIDKTVEEIRMQLQ